jgi:hypothetical protein
MSDGHRFSTIEVGSNGYKQELLQDSGIQDAYVDFEMQRLDEQLLEQKRLLTEVDHLLAQRIGPNQFGDTKDNLQNYATSMEEQAMPFRVSHTEHNIEFNPRLNKKTVMWLGKTAIQVAESGYDFHEHESVFPRIEIEKDEARLASTQDDDGRARVFVSPRMSQKDAPLEIARKEHLGDDDAIRVSWVKTLLDGSQKRVLQSLLVRDIPLSAWVAMFEDSQNIFGRSMRVEDPESALSIMKLHDQLEIDMSKLTNGPVTLIEAVVPYIDDIVTRNKVIEQSKKYYGDQDQMRQEAESKAKEWLAFDKELAESLVQGEATSRIKSFVYSLQHNWSDFDLAMLRRHYSDDGYKMTRELAAMLESAQQKLLAGRAALTTNKEHVLRKLGGDLYELQRLQKTERLISQAWFDGIDHNRLLATHNRELASRNVDGGGGGCAGSSSTEFGDASNLNDEISGNSDNTSESKTNWKWKKGVCRVESCSTRPGQTEVGPCDICHDCQDKFDDGRDPTQEAVKGESQTTTSIAELIVERILETRTAKNEQFTITA